MKKFTKPLNKWIEEDVSVEVTKPVMDRESGQVKLEKKTETVKQKSYYTDSTPKKMICSNHEYICLDKPRYLFKCTKCDWHFKAYPVTHKYDPETKHLTRRDNAQRV